MAPTNTSSTKRKLNDNLHSMRRNVRPKSTSNMKSIQCPACDQVFYDFDTKDLIKLHMMKKATCKATLLQCKGCLKYYFNLSDLNQHLSQEVHR